MILKSARENLFSFT